MEKPDTGERSAEEKEREERLKKQLSNIHNTILVISGKGGVGKTTVSVNLAYGLAVKGHRVGILDVDFHGPNTAKMLGIEGRQLTATAEGIEPVEVIQNLKAMSIALIIREKDRPVIWRGPLKMITIKQLLSDVTWGELDYLIVDSPPGTGDEPLSVCQLIPGLSGVIVVTTPQDVAILDSRKSVMFAKELKVPVLGIIENMSGLTCPHCGNRIDLFSKDGGKKASQELSIPFLGKIPIEPEMVKLADEGKPFIHFKNKTHTAKIMDDIADNIVKRLEKDG